jgi:hypothetical protein
MVETNRFAEPKGRGERYGTFSKVEEHCFATETNVLKPKINETLISQCLVGQGAPPVRNNPAP